MITIAAAVAAAAGLAFATAGASSAATLPTISVAMNGSSINVGGTLQSGGVDVASTVSNEPAGAPLLIRLNPGVSASQLYAFLRTPAAQDPNNVSRFGSIVFAANAPKGTSAVQTTLQAGDYVAFDAAKHNPARWPTTTFTVGHAGSPARLPSPDAKVRAIDFAFRAPKTLHDGDLVRFENDGFVVHMNVALQVRSDKTAKKLVKALLAGDDKAARKYIIGTTSFLDPVSGGAVEQSTLHAKPGVYVMACFMDTQDHREHTQLGMERIVHVKR